MFNGLIYNSSGGGAGVSGLTTADAGTAIGDNQIIRGDGATGIQGSAVTLSDVAASVVTQLVTAPTATTGASQVGRAMAITASAAVASTDTAGAAAGGAVNITSGAAARNTSGNANGGNINLVTGAGIGTGTAGQVVVPTGGEGAPGITLGTAGVGWYRTGVIGANEWAWCATTATLKLAQGEFDLVGNAPINWGDQVNTFNGSNHSAGIKRQANGVVRVTGGNSAYGAFLSGKLVEANVAGSGAPNVLTDIESGTVLTNEGVTAENYHTLPSAAAGYEFTFIVQDADGIRITANTGDTIRPIAGTAASAAAGFIRCATLGAFIRLQAINSTEWIATGSAGVWTIDV
jgi:hypothetical protein